MAFAIGRQHEFAGYQSTQRKSQAGSSDAACCYQYSSELLVQYLPASSGLLESTVAELPAWTHVLAGFPAVRWPTFAEYVRSRVNVLATEYHLNELACQLQLSGQVLARSRENCPISPPR